MDMKEIIRTRKSVRTFDGRPLTTGDREKLLKIAFCHFMSVTKGSLAVENPDIDVNENMEYIATVAVKE